MHTYFIRAVLSAILLPLLSTALHAGEFEIFNNSRDTLWCSVCYYSETKQGEKRPCWVVSGWYKATPGENIVVYSGNRQFIYLRIAKDRGVDGIVVRPRKAEDEISKFVHSKSFQIHKYRSGNYFDIEIEGKTQKALTREELLLTGVKLRNGFFRAPGNGNITIGKKKRK